MSLSINPYLSTTPNYTMNFGADKDNSNSSTEKNSSAGSYLPEGLEKALTQALKEISDLKDGENVKLDDIIEHIKRLEALFTEKVEKDLKALGITDFDFQIALDPKKENNEAITISAKNPETKALVEKYFAENTGIVEEFRKIQALKNLEKSITSNNGTNNSLKNTSIRALKANYQAQALDIFLAADNQASNSLLADFSGEETTFSSGIDYFV